jgi:hypothetical protein
LRTASTVCVDCDTIQFVRGSYPHFIRVIRGKSEFRHMPKLSIELPKPIEASNDCLPHAAMNLGSSNGVGTRPRPGMVVRLVLEEQFGNWVLYRLDASGGFVGDSWHGSREDAIHQMKKEFGVEVK